MKREYRVAGLSVWSAAAIFTGAFLLFQVQPIISKTILPWFGGSPAVWTTCLVFFQLALLAGYAFADWLTRLPQPRHQAMIHLTLVVVALLTLPIVPGAFWKPPDGSHPTWRILLLLAAKVGLPYFLLASTSPAVQSWFARAYPGRSPYRLYALSNVGSLGALLSYPFLVEPMMTTRAQGNMWSILFVLFAACCLRLTYGLWRAGPLPPLESAAESVPGDAARPSRGARLSWLLWPALASVALMAVTNHLCQDLAVVPFLWVAPLSLYLLTFIICFDRQAWYFRRGFAMAAAFAVLAVSYLPLAGYLERFYSRMGIHFHWSHVAKHVVVETAVYLAALFLICMVCHGELVRRKPAPRYLTSFYLNVAAGGALGGVLVGLVCPLVFSSYLELNLVLLVSFFVAVAVLVAEAGRAWFAQASYLIRLCAVLTGVMAAIAVAWGQYDTWDRERGLERARNFYGVLSIRERYADDPESHGLVLFHGDTVHGYQLLKEELKDTPTTYYDVNSGVGLALKHLRPDSSMRVGAVGLGAGTVAAYGRPGDTYRFYEINPLVIDLCQKHFTFLRDSQADIEIVPGDARLSLESEPPQQFDVLILDAFSGDTIPVHLLTQEALEIYQRHIKPDGVLAIHISNRYVNLAPVVSELAHHFEFPSVLIRQEEANKLQLTPSDWALWTRNTRFLQQPPIRSAVTRLSRWENFPLWTDQYNNLLQILYPPVFIESES